MRQIPYTEVTAGHTVSPAPADGDYLAVSHNDDLVKTRYGMMVEQVFPWRAEVFSFNAGMCEPKASGSSPKDMAERYDILEVFLVGLTEQRQQELTVKFAQIGIELVPTRTETAV